MIDSAKYIFAISILFLIFGCGGHEYEGEYMMKDSSSQRNKMAISMGIMEKFVLGPDYMEVDGERKKFDFSVREEGKRKYLVLEDQETGEKTDAFYIKDSNTLILDAVITSYVYTRIK